MGNAMRMGKDQALGHWGRLGGTKGERTRAVHFPRAAIAVAACF